MGLLSRLFKIFVVILTCIYILILFGIILLILKIISFIYWLFSGEKINKLNIEFEKHVTKVFNYVIKICD